jgi:hypothetical protein
MGNGVQQKPKKCIPFDGLVVVFCLKEYLGRPDGSPLKSSPCGRERRNEVKNGVWNLKWRRRRRREWNGGCSLADWTWLLLQII